MKKQERNSLIKKDPQKICAKDQRKLGGFTLIEVIVTIFVITIGLIGAFNVIQNITVQSRLAASRLTAVYLAQEGVEMIRNQRDTNWISTVPWNNNIQLTGSLGCSTSSILGKFNRVCRVSTSTEVIGTKNVEKMDISVGVSWQDRGTTHSVTSTTVLYNWLNL